MFFFFFFKQKTAYEMRISDWSSDVCSSDLHDDRTLDATTDGGGAGNVRRARPGARHRHGADPDQGHRRLRGCAREHADRLRPGRSEEHTSELQSLMRISYAVFCLKKKKTTIKPQIQI